MQTFGPSVHFAVDKALNFHHNYSNDEINEALADACADAKVKNLKNLPESSRKEIVARAAARLVEYHGVKLGAHGGARGPM